MSVQDTSTDPSERWVTVVLGNNAVGKTALLACLAGDSFVDEPSLRTTVTKPVHPDRETDIVDLAGLLSEEERIFTLRKLSVAVALIVVSATLQGHLERDLEYWTSHVRRACEQKLPARLLVATQADRVPHMDRGLLETMALKYEFDGVHITSAVEGVGIQELRGAVLSAVEQRRRGKKDDPVAAAVRAMTEALCEIIANDQDALRRVEWRDLERVVATALDKLGFTVELTPGSKDGGKDIVATCMIKNRRNVFYLEIKHWCNGDRPGPRHVTNFIEVNARDGTDGGLFLSSSGYTTCVHSRLAEISQQRVRLGEQEKIVSLCQQYVRSKHGLWCPDRPLPELLFDKTLEPGQTSANLATAEP